MEHVRPVGDALPDIRGLARTAAAMPTALKHLEAAVVRKRHRRSRWFRAGFAGVALALLAAGVWLQLSYEPVPPQDPTNGWRDYIWDKLGDTIDDCIIEMRRTGGEIDCRLSPPEPKS